MGKSKLYELTPEHRAQLEPWAEHWIKNAMSTKPMDAGDREAMRTAIRGLYQAANLTPPPDERIVFVPSPFVLRFAAGFAAALWWLRKNPGAAKQLPADATRDATRAATRDATGAATGAATRAATRDATWAATGDATGDATRDATWAATRDATWAATRAATGAATGDATGDATRDATWAATRAATWAATRDATWAATRDATWAATGDATWAATGDATRDATWDANRGAPESDENWYHVPVNALRALAGEIFGGRAQFALGCAQTADYMWDGGNQWSEYAAYLSFFRCVAKLGDSHGVDFSKWIHYEEATRHAGPRIMHAEFCIISDRPQALLVDDQNRPHCDTGPFCRWRDGTALYAVHGARVPMWVIEHPERLTAKLVVDEENAEVRRIMLERLGADRFITELGAKRVQADDYGELYRVNLTDDEPLVMVKVINSTPEPDGSHKPYWLRVPPAMETARQAVAWTWGIEKAEDYAPALET